MLSQMLKHIPPLELQKMFNEGYYNAGMMQGSRLEKRILTFANRSWPRGRWYLEFIGGLAITWCVAVWGRLRCANRPYIMWLIVTSPLIPSPSPLVCDQEWEKGANMRLWFGLATGLWIGTGHPLSLGRGLGWGAAICVAGSNSEAYSDNREQVVA